MCWVLVKNSPFLKTLVLTCWLPFVLMALGVHWESLQITGKKPQYIALGKIVESQLHVAIGSTAETEFFNQQIQILKSDELKVRTLKRVHGLHPEIEASKVKIAVTRAEGSFILKVAAIGEDQKYVRWYLDALLDEDMPYRVELAKAASSSPMDIPIILERPETALLDPPDLVGPLILGGGAGLMAGAVLMLLLAAAASAWQERSRTKADLLPD